MIQAPALSASQARQVDAALSGAIKEFLPAAGLAAFSAHDVQSPLNVIGVGIGFALETDGESNPTITFLVRRKVGDSALSKRSLLPRSYKGLKTQVEETGDIVASFAGRYRPAGGGASVGACNAHMAGTFGCLVRYGGKAHILSNNHVLAGVNQNQPGTRVPQPGLLDGGVCNPDVIARLTRFTPISFTAPNTVDCAIARVTKAAAVERRMMRPSGQWQKLASPHVRPALRAAVHKAGRTTGYTRGLIDLVSLTVNVNMGSPPYVQSARFSNQFRVVGSAGPFSAPGDSGSLVTTDPGNQPTGLLFAGGGGYTFCNDIGTVLSALNVSILY